MFEDRTYENIRDEMLAEFPSDIDTREGSIAYDAVAGVAAKVAMLYIDISNCYELTNLEKSSGEYLDRFASEHGVTRIKATNARYRFIYEGTKPELGTSFYDENGDNYYTLNEDDEGLILVSDLTGTTQNVVVTGTDAIPVDNIEGLIHAEFGELIVPAINKETDDSLRSRIRDKISGPAENGNRSQYQSWCEEVEGVGRALIYPLFYGPNTVKAVLISPDGLPPAKSVIDNVQTYIDPIKPAYIAHDPDKPTVVIGTLGSGYGDGVAPIGAHFLAVAAKKYDVNIQLSVELKTDINIDDVKNKITQAITAYFKSLALEAEDSKVIRFNRISSIIEQLNVVFDFYNLTVNGKSENVTIEDDYVAVLAGVTVNVTV